MPDDHDVTGVLDPPETEIERRLGSAVAAAVGRAAVRLVPAAGGASNLAFTVIDPEQPMEPPLAFLRCAAPAGGLTVDEYSLRREAEILRRAAELGFPVAPVIAVFDAPVALLMEVVPGTSRPDPDEIDRVGPEYMRLIAAVHRADPAGFPVEVFTTISDALRHDLEWWTHAAATRGVMEEPLIALGAAALRSTFPDDPSPPSLVHGDVGAGNFMALDGRVSALLDWELAHVGDPHEDLAWLWMRGAHTDFGDPRRRIAEYVAAGGGPVTPERLRWQLAFVMWKTAVATHVRLRHSDPDGGSLLQVIVRLTYDALLGSQVVRLLGGSLPLLAQRAREEHALGRLLATELLATTGLSTEQRIVVDHLGQVAAHADWVHREFESDCRSLLGAAPEALGGLLSRGSDRLLPIALALGRNADRRAMALPNAVRRIARAQRIRLGTGDDPTLTPSATSGAPA